MTPVSVTLDPTTGIARRMAITSTARVENPSMQAMIQNDQEKEWMLPLLELRNELDGDDRSLRDFRRMNGIPSSTPVRLGLPAMDDGPHLNYAIQWFTFAVVALVGVGTLIAQDIKRG